MPRVSDLITEKFIVSRDTTEGKMPASFKVSFQIIFFSVHGVFPKGGGLQKGEGYIEIADTLLLIGIASIGKAQRWGFYGLRRPNFQRKAKKKE